MRKEEIIEQATELFLQHGYKTITMDEIASELGISKKTLYEHMGNKVNLIKASVEHQLDEFQILFEGVLSQDLDAIEEITTIISKIKNRVSNPEHNTALFQLQKYYAKVYQNIYLTQMEFARNVLKQNMLKGQAQYLYREDINADYFSEIVMTTQNSLKCSANSLQNMEKFSILSDIHFDLMMRGVLTKQGLDNYEKLEIIS